MALISNRNLDFWIKNNLNVLLIGHAGVGKTHIVLEAFKRHGLRCQYYSCSTLDPYVDFIGVPREVDDPESNMKVLDLVRPKQWARDEIEVLFLDEYNRSKMAVRNAVMELIQFKSINGKKFNNLRMVWAAINPDETDENITYDVEPLDPAQKDRFQVHFEVPYQPDMEYMESKFGKTSAKLAIEWWKSLDQATKYLVSPRRLEYAVSVHSLGGEMGHILPKVANPSSLQKRLGSISVVEKINMFMDKDYTDLTEVKSFFENETNYHYGLSAVLENQKTWSKLLPCFPTEKLNAILATKGNEKILSFAVANPQLFESLFNDVAKMSNDSNLKRIICASAMKTSATPNSLKEQLGLNKKDTKILPPVDTNQEEYITKAIKSTNEWISTFEKTKLIKDYVSKFATDKQGRTPRSEELLKQETEMLYAIAARMHDYSLSKVLESNVYLTIGGQMLIKKYFDQNKPHITADPRYAKYASHLKPIMLFK